MASLTRRVAVLVAVPVLLGTCAPVTPGTQPREAVEKNAPASVEQLIAQGNDCIKQRKYDQALTAAEEALKLDPGSAEAEALRDQARAWLAIVKAREDLRQYPDPAIERMIADVMDRPTEAGVRSARKRLEAWLARRARGTMYDVTPLGKPKADEIKRVRQQLAKPVTIEFPGTSFENAIDFLTDLTGVGLNLDQKALVRQGIGPDTTIKLKLANVPLERALRIILQQVNLEYTFKDGRIFITDAKGLPRQYEVRVYDVRDLLLAMGGAGRDRAASGNANNTDRFDNGLGNANGRPVTNTDSVRITSLVNLIKKVVAPDTWTEAGTEPKRASIEPFRNEMLVITQTGRVHNQIWYLVRWLRAYLSDAAADP